MRVHLLTALIVAAGLLFAAGCGDDDENPTGPDQNTPAELVGTWEWTVTSENGVPQYDFAQYSFTDTSTSQQITFNSGGTWETREYYNDQGPVYTRNGTCYDTDSLYVTVTNDNGTPVNEGPDGASWLVVGNTLTLGQSVIMPSDTLIIMSIYTKL
jgi:hypothetical protein